MTRKDETFLLYNFSDFEEYETDNPTGFYCLSESTLQIALGALRFSNWRTRWRVDRFDTNRRIDDNILWARIEKLVTLAQKELLKDMSCDLETALQTIATAIGEANPNTALAGIQGAIEAMSITQTNEQTVNCGDCGGGGTTVVLRPPASTIPGVVGSVDQGSGETVPIYGINPPLGVEPGQFPEGYESEEEYLLDKCQMANLMVDGIVQTLRNLGALGVFNFIALTGLIILAIVGVIVFPPAFVPVAAAAIGVLSVGVTILAVVADEIEANRSEWVCALYNSDSTEAAIEAIADLLDIIISSLEVTGPVGVAIKTICLILVNGETLNQLFTKTSHILYPDADCSACETCKWVRVTGTGPLEFPYDEEFQLVATDVGGGFWQVTGQYPASCGDCVNHNLRVISISGGPMGGGGNITDCSDTDVWRYDNQGYGALTGIDWCAQRFTFVGTGQFTVTLTIEEATC